MLIDKIRYELLTPIENIVNYCNVLLEDARQGPEEFLADVAKMHSASHQLLTDLRQLLEGAEQKAGPSGDPLTSKDHRHAIGNRLNYISGLCQLLLEDDTSRQFGAYLGDLNKIRSYCIECEQKLLRREQPRSSDDQAGEDESVIDAVLRDLPTNAEDNSARHVAPGCILVVDDNANNRDVLGRLLRQQGHHSIMAQTGAEALALLAAQPASPPIDLILLDVVMPGINGLECLQRLKADPRWRRLPVLMVSFFDDLGGVLRCLEMGAEDYLPKPVDRLLLQVRVGACLEKKRLQDREQHYLKQIEAEQRFSDQLLHDLLPAAIVQESSKTRKCRRAAMTAWRCSLPTWSALPPTATATNSLRKRSSSICAVWWRCGKRSPCVTAFRKSKPSATPSWRSAGC